jgi:hypothetical protein
MKFSKKLPGQFVILMAAAAMGYFLSNPDAASVTITALGIGTVFSSALKKLSSTIVGDNFDKLSKFIHEQICKNEEIVSANIKQVFGLALTNAVGKFKTEYHSISSTKKYDDQLAVDRFLDDISDLSSALYEHSDTTMISMEEITTLLKGTPSAKKALLFSKLDIDDELDLMNDTFKSLFSDKFTGLVIECFMEELLSSNPNSIRAWREFEKLQFDILAKYDQQVLDNQHNLFSLVSEFGDKLETINANVLYETQVINSAFRDITLSTSSILNHTLNIEKILKTRGLDQLQLFTEAAEWINRELGRGRNNSPTLNEFVQGLVYVPLDLKNKALDLLNSFNDVIIQGTPASGKTIFGLSIALEWSTESDTVCIFFDVKDFTKFSYIDPLIKVRADIAYTIENIRFLKNDAKVLLILDNAHTNLDFSRRVVNIVEESRNVFFNISILCLSRKIVDDYVATNSILDCANMHSLNITADCAAFEGTAKRLCARYKTKPILSEATTKEWMTACGGDLIVFSFAYKPNKSHSLDENEVNELVKTYYLTKAEEQIGGREHFIDLCVINSLDIDFDYETMWNAYRINLLFPNFAQEMIIETTNPVKNSSKKYCRLFHPSMAKLILEVVYGSKVVPNLIARIINLGVKNPPLLGLVLIRLNSGSYWNEQDIQLLIHEIKKTDNLPTQILNNNPAYYRILEIFDLTADWSYITQNLDRYQTMIDALANLPLGVATDTLKYLYQKGVLLDNSDVISDLLANDYFRKNIINNPVNIIVIFLRYLSESSLKNDEQKLLNGILYTSDFRHNLSITPPSYFVQFLKYLSQSALKEEIPILLKEIMDSEEFIMTLVSTPADGDVTFLKYLSKSALKDEEPQLLKELIQSREFRNNLRRHPTGSILTFLRYLSKSVHKNEEPTLIKEIVQSSEFRMNLRRTPVDMVVALLGYLADSDHKDEESSLLAELLHNPEFRMNLRYSPAGAIVTFLGYLSNSDHKEEEAILFNEILDSSDFRKNFIKQQFFNYLSGLIPFIKYYSSRSHDKCQVLINSVFDDVTPDIWAKSIEKATDVEAASLAAVINRHMIDFPKEFYTSLLDKAGDKFKKITPHPDYPQEDLVKMSVSDIICLLGTFVTFDRHKANCIVASLMDNMDVFNQWLATLAPEAMEIFKSFSKQRGFKALNQYLFIDSNESLSDNVS